MEQVERVPVIRQLLAEVLEKTFLTEQNALSNGYFSDLSVAEMRTLQAIGPYERRSMSETAALLNVTLGTLTVSVDRLIRKGYVLRNRDREDRRVVRVFLTRKGKLAYRMYHRFQTNLTVRILDGLNPDEQHILQSTLRTISDFMTEQNEKYAHRDYRKRHRGLLSARFQEGEMNE